MQIQIHAQSFALTDGLREHVAWRAAYATNYSRDAVSRLVVHLSDINGPRGGVDKCCRVEARLKGAQSLVVEDIQSDLYVAIDRAFERIGRSLHRQVMRRRRVVPVSLARRHVPEDMA